MTEYDETTTRVYWQMMGVTEWCHDWTISTYHGKEEVCKKCKLFPSHALLMTKEVRVSVSSPCLIPDPITMSVGDLAEYMMRRCIQESLDQEYKEQLEATYFGHTLWMATPKDRIRAACVAWEAKG